MTYDRREGSAEAPSRRQVGTWWKGGRGVPTFALQTRERQAPPHLHMVRFLQRQKGGKLLCNSRLGAFGVQATSVHQPEAGTGP